MNKIKLLIERPELLLQHHNIIKEEEWEQIFNYLKQKRMDKELYEMWLNSQKNNGIYKYKAIGQLFARFAELKRGFKTLNKSSFNNNEGNSI